MFDNFKISYSQTHSTGTKWDGNRDMTVLRRNPEPGETVVLTLAPLLTSNGWIEADSAAGSERQFATSLNKKQGRHPADTAPSNSFVSVSSRAYSTRVSVSWVSLTG
jgi:hypothetical protein